MNLCKALLLAICWSVVACFHAKPLPNLTTLEGRTFPVNPKIDPCENFYEYACSEVIADFKLRPDRSKHTFAFDDSRERIREIKQDYFKQLVHTDTTNKKEAQIKNYYEACVNLKANKKEEKEFVGEVLQQMDQINSKDDMLAFLAQKVLSPDHGLVYVSSMASLQDPSKLDVIYGPDGMSLPEKSYYENPKLMESYQALVELFFKSIGFSDYQERAKQVVDFEKGFAKIYPLPSELRKRITQDLRQSRKKFISLYPNLKLGILNKAIPKANELRDFVPEGMSQLNAFLNQATLKQIKNIYLYKNLESILDIAYPEYRKASFDFDFQYLGGPKKRSKRDEECTEVVMGAFTKEVDSLLYKRLFPDFPKEKVLRIAQKVRAALIDQLKENHWLSAKAKSEAIRKMKLAKLQVVSPNNDREWDFKPDGSYDAKKPISNARELAKVYLKKFFMDLKQGSNPDAWKMGVLTINAYYSLPFNKFVMPAGILQYPFFISRADDAANLGGVGAVVAHELGHGIDDQGSKLDQKGRLRRWMTKKDLKEFKRRSRQLVDQFNAIGHDGELTLGENTADLVGVTTSYRAAFPKGVGTKEAKQKFFLQWARVWCQVERPKSRELRLKTDPHALGFARVNEQVKQQPGFQEAFACKEGDPMVLPPEKRVRIW